MSQNRCEFEGPPTTREEVGLRLDYLRSQNRIGASTTIGEAAAKVGTSTTEVAASKKFYDSDRKGY
jgi:hypothetical protein